MTSSDDDPEARIRELEQPLTDQARTSEFGGDPQPGGYQPDTPPTVPYPATPPPVTYGPPFPMAPLKTDGGFRAWWLLLAIFVIGAIALAAGIAIYSANLFSRSGSVISSPSARPGITHIPSSSPAPGTTGPTSTAPPGETLTVSGIHKNETIACDNSVVTVSGISNTVTITGHCARLNVSGIQNSVTVDAADDIQASGFENKVTFHTGSPQVSSAGSGNVVQQG